MTLHVVTGRANAGKTGVAYKRLRSAVSEGRRAVLVLPAVPDVERARREFSQSSQLGIEITTFGGLVSSRWEETGDGRAIVTPAQRAILLELLSSATGQSRGLARLASGCVDALTEGSGSDWRAVRGRVSPAGAALADLLDAYALELDRRGLVEMPEATRLLGQCVGEQGQVLVVHRFTDFTPSQVALIRAMSEKDDVTVTLTWDEEFAPTCVLTEILHELGKFSSTHVSETTSYTPPALDKVGNELFIDAGSLNRDPALRLGLAEGEAAQARLVADEIALALSSGVAESAERIAVVCRDLAQHYSALRSALEQAGQAAQFDMPMPFAAAPLGAALLDGLAFAFSGERSRLLRLLRSPFSAVERPEARRLEQRWRKRGLVDPERLLREVSEAGGEGLARVLGDLRAASASVASRPMLACVGELVTHLYATGAVAEAAPAREVADSSAHRAVFELLNDVLALGELGLTLGQLSTALSEHQITQSASEKTGHVQIMSAPRIRGRRFDVVIIAGLNVGEFPRVSAEHMLPDTAIDQVLHSFGGRVLNDRGEGFEDLLFYECVSRAKKRLVLVARETDDDGEASRVSSYYQEVADRFRSDDEASSLVFDSYRRLSEPPSPASTDERERLRARAGDARHDDERLQAARNRLRPRPGGLHCGWEWNEETTVSPSQIEAYIRCPYRWFHEYAVRPRELEPTYGARDEGEYSHELLAATYSQLIAEGAVPVTPRSLPSALGVLDAAYTRSAEEITAPLEQRLGRARAKAWASRILHEDAERDDGFHPAYLEWEFGRESNPVDLGGLLLAGRVDRIDVDGAGNAVVVDYKRSIGPQFGAEKILSEGRVQLPLYMTAVSSRLELNTVAGLYRGLSDVGERGVVQCGSSVAERASRRDVLEHPEMHRLLEAVLELAAEAAAGMRAGEIRPCPRTDGACKYCPVRRSCGSAR